MYEDCDIQIEKLMSKLRDSEEKYRDLQIEFSELQEANLYMKRELDEKDEYIQELESKEPMKVYQPVSQPIPRNKDNFEVGNLKRKLKITEEENEKLREQAFSADKEVDRLKENIILREREIHNVKKSIKNKDNFPAEMLKFNESEAKDKLKSDFMLSVDTNPNLVNEFAKMSGSSGFKYGAKGPYDESLEKLRKEFSQQQKELGLETLSEASISHQDKLKNPNKTIALLMGQGSFSPTGDLKIDYHEVLEENKKLKMIVNEMRKEMEDVVNKINKSKQNNSSKFLSQKNGNYLDETNLKMLEKQTEINKLKEEVEILKYSSPQGKENNGVLEKLERKLEEKRKIIEKLREERDNLLNICSEMKIELSSMRKQQEYSLEMKEENTNINNITTNNERDFARPKQNMEKVKNRLDNLGEHVQELFSEFKTALNTNKRSNSNFTWKRPNTMNQANVIVSGTK